MIGKELCCPSAARCRWHYRYMIVVWNLLTQAIAVGLGLSYGVLHIEFMDYFKQPAAETSLIGSINNGVSLISGPLISAFCSRVGMRKTILLGSIISTAGLLISSYATSIYWLYVSYGFLAGLGYGMVYVPLIGILASYFEDNKLDISICLASTGIGVGVLIFPPVIERFVVLFSWRGTMMLLSAFAFQICVFGALSPPRKATKLKEPDLTRTTSTDSVVEYPSFRAYFKACDCVLLTNWRFLFILSSEVLWNLTLCLLLTHLPYFAKTNGHPQRTVCWLISIIGILGTVGRILMAIIGAFRKLNKTAIVFTCSILSGIALMLIGVAKHEFLLLSATVGLFGFAYGAKYALLNCMLPSMFGADKVIAGVGYLSVAVGIGQICGPPIGGVLYDLTEDYPSAFYVGGSFAFASALLFIPLLVKPKEKDTTIVQMTYSLEMKKGDEQSRSLLSLQGMNGAGFMV